MTPKHPLAAENLEIKGGNRSGHGGGGTAVLIQNLKLAKTSGIALELHKGPYVSYL